MSMFNISNDQFDFAVYYFGLATGPFDAGADRLGRRSQAMRLMARERIPGIFNLAKYLQQQLPLTLNEIALILYYVRDARNAGQFLDGPACECRIEIAQTNPELVLDGAALGLTQLPRAHGQGWNLLGGVLQSPQPDVFQLQAQCSYHWAPPGVAYQELGQALLRLDCSAVARSDSVHLVLTFHDQPAWLFQQAQFQAQAAINAIISGLAYQGLTTLNVVNGLLTPYQALACFMVTHLKQLPPGA
jgi:hypothetical protein